MAEYLIQEETLDEIAHAINVKGGWQNIYRADEMAEAIESIPSGQTITEGLVYKAYNANGEPIEADYYGNISPRSLHYFWFNNPAPVVVNFVSLPSSIGKTAMQRAYINPNIQTLRNVASIGDYGFAIEIGSGNNLSSQTLTLPEFTGAGDGGSRFRVSTAAWNFFYNTLIFPKMVEVHDYDFYQMTGNNKTFRIGSIGFGVNSCGIRPFGGASGTGTIYVYTTGALLDTIRTAIKEGAGAGFEWNFMASENTTYNGVSYNAGDTMLRDEASTTASTTVMQDDLMAGDLGSLDVQPDVMN